MPDVLIRNVDPERLGRLKRLAAANRRSMQAEAARIFEEAIDREVGQAAWWDEAARLRELTKGTDQTDSAELLREDRDSDRGRDGVIS